MSGGLTARRRLGGARGLSIALALTALAPGGVAAALGPTPRAPATVGYAARAPGAAAGSAAIATEPCAAGTLLVTRVPFVIDMTRCDPRSILLKGPSGLGVMVPPDGSSVEASVLGGRGMQSLVVDVDLTEKRVTVSGDEPGGPWDALPTALDDPTGGRAHAPLPPPPAPSAASSRERSAAAPISPCRDAAYRSDGAPLPSKGRRRPVLKWWYYPGWGPVAYLNARQRKRAFLRGTRIAVRGQNNCRLGRVSIRQVYKGSTWRPPGVLRSGACGRADGRNVRGWMRFRPGETMLGLTCKWFRRGKMVEGDIALNASGARWATSKKRCRADAYDAVGVAAHETLHHLGLAHVKGARHRKLTMFPAIDTCEFHWRTLGLGDFLGLKRLYGRR